MKFPSQSLANKKGEVTFRKKLIYQHTQDTIVSKGEPTQKEHLTELKQRLERTQDTFNYLANKGIPLSPFLEIAAGEGYRSDFLSSRYGAKGFATDISLETLSADRIFIQKLKLQKKSIKICADAYNLPFLSNSFPFVFIALSLHHFPDPTPIIQEATRVMTPNGYFYFDEEPIKQGLNLNLWRRDYHLRWFEKLLKYTFVLIFLSRIGKAEVEHGILEETFSLKLWEKALAPFYKVEIEESVFPPQLRLKQKLFKNAKKGWIFPNLIVRLGLFLFGGGIKGICQLTKSGSKQKFKSIYEILSCPNCQINNKILRLKKSGSNLRCAKCKTVYYKKKGVWLLLENALKAKLYAKET